MDNYEESDPINVGVGKDISIRGLAEIIRDVVGYPVELVFDLNQPDGTPRKVLDVSRITDLGWKARTSLKDGLAIVYDWYVKNY